jgi:ATP-dependent RNA helicase DDX31/DBP7
MASTNGLTVDLSLNIIAQPVPTSKAAVTPNANKKTNKYERRRQRSKQVSTKKTAAVAVGRGIRATVMHNTTNALVSNSDKKDKISAETTQLPQLESQNVEDESQHQSKLTVNTECSTRATILADKNTSVNVQEESIVPVMSEKKNPNSTIPLQTEHKSRLTDDTKATRNHNKTLYGSHDNVTREESEIVNRKEEPTTTSAKRAFKTKSTGTNLNYSRHHNNIDEIPPTASLSTTATAVDIDATTAARAAYMAEFHARPMELDRRAGIRNYSSTAIPGNASNQNNSSSHDDTTMNDRTNGDDPNSSMDSEINTWENLPLHTRLLSAIHQSIGATSRPTTIQCQAIPLLLRQQEQIDKSQPKNVFIHSETGSGKTLAYLLPILQSMMITTEPSTTTPGSTTTTTMTTVATSSKLSRFDYGTRCVIICPTRELAVQTSIVCERMCRASGLMHIVPGCLGGSISTRSNDNTTDSRSTEKVRLRKGLGIVIATPGRLLDHLKRTESLRTTIQRIQFMILDEVDRLLDSGLGQQVQEIIHIIQSLISTNDKNMIYVPWRSVFVSATVTEQVQTLARDILTSKDPLHRHQTSPSWIVVSGRKGDSTKLSIEKEISRDTTSTSDSASNDVSSKNTMMASLTSPSFAESSPKQLIQMHVTCSAKLRLTSLIAFLLERTVKGETTVVFVSTCASVDYYYTLLTSMDSILPPPIPTSHGDTKSTSKGIFGQNCPIFKLHGNVPQNERQKVLNKFKEAATARIGDSSRGGGSVLFATDVAARGLNLPSVDWIVQFDVPCDVADYVHRAGRVARAGGVGHAVLFLLPSEKEFLSILQQRGIVNMSPMSLTLILNTAADICKSLTQQGILRGGGSLQKDNSKERSSSRPGEAFCIELQFRLEDCVVQDDLNAKTIAKSAKKEKTRGREAVSGQLIDMARDAFLSYIRAYPTKEKSVRHIFAAKALHLGHVARSFALKEPPKKVVVASQTTRKRKLDKLEFSEDKPENSKKKHLSFETVQSRSTSRDTSGRGKKKMSMGTVDQYQQLAKNGKGRSLLLANAVKLQSNGLDGL